jgi:hypothetical protein
MIFNVTVAKLMARKSNAMASVMCSIMCGVSGSKPYAKNDNYTQDGGSKNLLGLFGSFYSG